MIEDEGRLRWMCRRGMLELDFLLERFLNKNGYYKLSADDQALFEEMMQEPDPVLYNWFLGSEKPEPKFVSCIAAIMEK
jgi:antitoxin CptB